MIKTKEELRYYLRVEKPFYQGNMNSVLFWILSHSPIVVHESPELYKYVRTLRKTEYYINSGQKILGALYKLRLRILQYRHGLALLENVFGPGLKIRHLAQTRVSSAVKCGSNFTIYPFCSIGTGHDASPEIGDNVTVFSGARVIGPIKLANGIQVGANAVVTKSCDIENAVLAGVPAKLIKVNTGGGNLVIVGFKRIAGYGQECA